MNFSCNLKILLKRQSVKNKPSFLWWKRHWMNDSISIKRQALCPVISSNKKADIFRSARPKWKLQLFQWTVRIIEKEAPHLLNQVFWREWICWYEYCDSSFASHSGKAWHFWAQRHFNMDETGSNTFMLADHFLFPRQWKGHRQGK